MLFKNIPGQEAIKSQLINSVKQNRIPHAQLFIGKEGSGVLAIVMAYAQYILCHQSKQLHCHHKCEHVTHPDLHFVFPTATNDKVKSHPVSTLFINEWREFTRNQPFGTLFDWYRHIGIDHKQGQIGVDEARNIMRILSLKPYESTHKVIIIWMLENMNVATVNKLLKAIEEPPKHTVFLFITEESDRIIDTILSRCQIISLGHLSRNDICTYLKEQGVDAQQALLIAGRANGNLNKAINLWQQDSEDITFGKWFASLMRISFSAKGNKSSILGLISWSNQISQTGRETQKQFIQYCTQIIRQALMKNYNVKKLVYIDRLDDNFQIEKFAPFIHSRNILLIIKLFEDAEYHIGRNANAKMVFSDLSIHMTRYLHIKENVS